MRAMTPEHRAALVQNFRKATEARKAAKLLRGPFLSCAHCGKTFTCSPVAARRGRRTCSNECRYAFKRGVNGANSGGGSWMKGPLNPNWKGGRSDDRHQAHGRDPRVHNWRRLVLAADGYRCRRCKAGRSSRLVAHHVILWSRDKALRFEPSNGVCLCWPCHLWVHSKANTSAEFLG